MSEHLFEDTLIITRLDPDGKKFDKVSRVEAHSEQLDTYMQLDVATDVHPVRAGEKFNMVLAPTQNLDGTPDTGYYTQTGRKTLADNYEYVMQGKLYKISEDTSSQNAKVEIYASFGGLLSSGVTLPLLLALSWIRGFFYSCARFKTTAECANYPDNLMLVVHFEAIGVCPC